MLPWLRDEFGLPFRDQASLPRARFRSWGIGILQLQGYI
jgi:hypothetical protein